MPGPPPGAAVLVLGLAVPEDPEDFEVDPLEEADVDDDELDGAGAGAELDGVELEDPDVLLLVGAAPEDDELPEPEELLEDEADLSTPP
jgi:hypothetical protein